LIASLCTAQVVGPKISTPVTSHDFGFIRQGDIVKIDFQVINTGDDALKIGNISASCGCTAAIAEKKELTPGEATKINVEFNTTGKIGKQSKHINVASNDPKTPNLDLLISSVVLRPAEYDSMKANQPKLEFTEKAHDFGTVKEGDKLDYTFSFANKGGARLEITNVSTSCGCTVASISTKILAPAETGTLKVEFDTSGKSGKTTRAITVTSNDEDEPNKVLTVTADIKKDDSKK